MKKLPLLTLCLLLLCAFGIRKGTGDDVIRVITQYFAKRPMERIFVHHDKPFYVSGDELWYAAYVLDYNTNTTSNLSEILHIEIFNKHGEPVTEHRVQISDGLANGMIKLPDTLAPDYYLLKAYTNWSRNFEEGLAFNHYFKIVSSNFEEKDQAINKRIDFYPEGGRLLIDKVNKVAFNTNRRDTLDCFVTNIKNDTLNRFTYNGNGLGSFRVIPKKEDQDLFLIFEGDKKRNPLPLVDDHGSILRLKETNSSFRISIEASEEYHGTSVSILFLNHGNVIASVDKEIKSNGLFLPISKNKLPNGLIHILVISENSEVLNERLLFNRPEPSSLKSLEVTNLQKTYKAGDIVAFDLNSTNSQVSNVSVSVIPLKYFSQAFKKLITHDQLNIDKRIESINNHLITERISTYNNEDILKDQDPKFQFPREAKEYFQVNIELNENPNSLGEFYSVSLKENDSIDFYFTKNESEEKLRFIVPAFNGTKSLIVKPHEFSSQKTLRYSLQSSIGSKPFVKEFEQSEYEYLYAKDAKENKLISRLYNLDPLNKVNGPEEPITFSILSVPSKSIVLKEYVYLPDMPTIFLELLPCAKLKKSSKGVYRIQMCNVDELTGKTQEYLKNEPLRIIDGVPIYDSNIITELDPREVKKINLTYGKFKLNGVEFDGVFNVETIEGNYGRIYETGHGFFDLRGYSDAYEFKTQRLTENVPSFRSTLYWKPDIVLNGGKPKTISFPSSNDIGRFKIEVQGITNTGKPIFEEFFFEVK